MGDGTVLNCIVCASVTMRVAAVRIGSVLAFISLSGDARVRCTRCALQMKADILSRLKIKEAGLYDGSCGLC